eukprot:m.15673 g.15673  ORF g.15673 m.15673 type:complete len:268 (-) comp3054_c0_seq1:98-901(-)
MSDVVVADQCSGDFSPLQEYFGKLTVGQLARSRVTEQDVLEAAAPTHKMLMRVFWNEKLAGLVVCAGSDPFAALWTPSCGDSSHSESTIDTTLNLNGKMISCRFKAFKPVHSPVYSSDELAKSFTANQLHNVKRAIFSSNNLLDLDMEHITHFVEQMLPACEIIDLSNNRFHGYPLRETLDIPLLRLLNISHVHFVDITINGVATVDRVDFFQFLATQQVLLSKLIFVPESWIAAGHWRRLFTSCSSEVVEGVERSHRLYYKSIAQK